MSSGNTSGVIYATSPMIYQTMATSSIYNPTGIQLDFQADVSKEKVVKEGISIRLFFKFVKSKLSKLEVQELKQRVSVLRSLDLEASELGQQALLEESRRLLVTAVREQEAAVCGFDRWVTRALISKYMGMVKDGQHLIFCEFEKFPRRVPDAAARLVKKAKEKGIFDEYLVLYTDYSGEKLKTTAEKIREKDPVVFGGFLHDKQKAYFICDWVDEYCDLTLEKIINDKSFNKEVGSNGRTVKPTEKYLDEIKAEVLARAKRLGDTRPSNWQDQLATEKATHVKKTSRLFRLFSGIPKLWRS